MFAILLSLVLPSAAAQRLETLAREVAGKSCPAEARLELSVDLAAGKTIAVYSLLTHPLVEDGCSPGYRDAWVAIVIEGDRAVFSPVHDGEPQQLGIGPDGAMWLYALWTVEAGQPLLWRTADGRRWRQSTLPRMRASGVSSETIERLGVANGKILIERAGTGGEEDVLECWRVTPRIGFVRTGGCRDVQALRSGRLSATAATVRLDALLSHLHEQHAFSGAVVLARAGTTVYARGFGLANVEAGTPFTPGTATDGASLTKPVTAAAVLSLVSEGRIDLDAPVQRYVAEYPHDGTTVRHLLTHGAALPDYGAFQEILDGGAPVGTLDFLRELARRRFAPRFAPGSAFEYCNLCYDVLALVVERVSNEPYERFVRSHLFAKAGMTSSFLRPARFADWRGVRTRGYRWSAGGPQPFDAFDNEAFYGGGNLYFTASDLAAWMTAWSEGSVPAPEARTLALASAEAGGVSLRLTLGNWYCDHARRRCYYTGHHQGFHNFAGWDSEKRLSIALVSNGTLSAPLQSALPRALLALAQGEEPEALELSSTPPTQRVDLSAAAGTYAVPQKANLVVGLDGQGAFLRQGDGATYALHHSGWETLYAPGLDVYLSFDNLRNGAYRRVRATSILESFTAVRIGQPPR